MKIYKLCETMATLKCVFFFHIGGAQMQLFLIPIRFMELLAIGCSLCLESQMEQHFSNHNFKHLTLIQLLHLQFSGKIPNAKLP